MPNRQANPPLAASTYRTLLLPVAPLRQAQLSPSQTDKPALSHGLPNPFSLPDKPTRESPVPSHRRLATSSRSGYRPPGPLRRPFSRRHPVFSLPLHHPPPHPDYAALALLLPQPSPPDNPPQVPPSQPTILSIPDPPDVPSRPKPHHLDKSSPLPPLTTSHDKPNHPLADEPSHLRAPRLLPTSPCPARTPCPTLPTTQPFPGVLTEPDYPLQHGSSADPP